MGNGMSRSASKKEREPMSGVGTVLIGIIGRFMFTELSLGNTCNS